MDTQFATAQETEEAARQKFEAFVAGWNSHDPDRLLALVTDDVVWEDPFIPGGIAKGKSAVREWLASLWRSMPDLEFAVGDVFVSPDRRKTAASWSGVAHMTGPLDPPGFAPTDGRIEAAGIDIHEYRGDLISRVYTVTDVNAVARQMGAAPEPGSKGERVGVLVQRLTAGRRRRKGGA